MGTGPPRSFAERSQSAGLRSRQSQPLRRAFFKIHSVAELATETDHWHELQGRLTEPMVLRKNATHYEPIAWDDAFNLIAEELHALSSPNEAIFYTSGRTVNEAAYLYQLMARRFGTNNLPDCSNMCHESSGAAQGHHRHRQRHREPAGFRGGGGYFSFSAKPRHQSSAHAELAAGRQT